MNQFNIIISFMIFVSTPALGVALLDYLVFNLVHVISGGVRPFLNRSRMPIDDKFHESENDSRFWSNVKYHHYMNPKGLHYTEMYVDGELNEKKPF